MEKPKGLYLLQKYDDGTFFVYNWTPMQATKGYKVLTAEEAEPYLELAKTGKNNELYLEGEARTKIDRMEPTNFKTVKAQADAKKKRIPNIPEIPPMEVPEEEFDEESAVNMTDSIVEDVVTQPVEKKADGEEKPKPLSVSQDEIFEMEIDYIRGLQHKSTLETHLLDKYQLEIPIGRLATMKSFANQMLKDLAKDNRLYLVDGKVTK